MVDVSRSTTNVQLPAELSNQIWADSQESSVIMSATPKIDLPGPGVTVQTITGDPVAEWVQETGVKPLSRPTLGSKAITPYKLAVIVPFSDEFRRDANRLYNALAARIPGALGKKFDETVLGAAGTSAPGANFDTLAGAPAMTVDGTQTLADLVAVYQALAAAGGDLSHWIASPSLVGNLIAAESGKDGFNLASSLQVGSVFGAPVLKTRASMAESTTAGDTVGFAGDFAGSAMYGTVEGVQVSISDTATLQDGENTINLWQQNMFAVRAEIEVGFRLRDVNHFVRIDDGVTDGA